MPGGTFAIVAQNNSAENRYIQRVTLDGQPYEKPYVDHATLMSGGTLCFEMGPEPQVWYSDALAD